MTTTITIPDSDEQLQIAVNKRARASGNLLLNADQKFACVLLKLAPAVTQGDYPALKTAIEAVTGIQEISLLVDGRVPVSIPVDHRVRLYLEAQVRIEDIPGEP